MELLFEDSRLVVQTNGCGEIFIHHKENPRSRVRIGPEDSGLILTAHDGQITPWAKNGLPAVRITGR